MLRKHFVLITAALVVAAMALPAAAKPDFSGTWKLVPDKSDYGPMPMPEKYEQAIDHKDPDVKVQLTSVSPQGEFKVDWKYSTDGNETTNDLRGNAMKCKAKWDGDTLVVESKLDFQGNEVTFLEKWSLSDEGKTITVNRKINSPQGEMEMKIVMAKQ